MRAGSPRRIIVFCLPGIGDAILFTPALHALRLAFPTAHITVVTMFRGAADVLSTNPDADEVQWFDFFKSSVWASLRYIYRLRRQRFDLGILGFPANRLEYNVLNALVSRRWRAGHRYRRQRWRNLHRLSNIAVDETPERHNVEENLALVEAICARFAVPMPAPAPELTARLTRSDMNLGDRLLADRGLSADHLIIGLHTYSSTFKNMHRKCWDKDRFVELIRRLGEEYPKARVLVFSGPSDAAVNDYIARQSDSRVWVVEQSNLRVALAMLRHCRLFISNDSALMHLAGALGVPVVALFGPTSWRRLHPWGVVHTIVREDLPCMPCFEYSSRPLHCAAGLDYACMRDLSMDRVLEATRQFLDTGLRAPRSGSHA